MNKILTALKFFNEKNNQNDMKNQNSNEEPEKEKANSPTKEGESRPRTSRCKRSAKQRKKSGNSNCGNNSALGFHSNIQNHPLIHNIENLKNPHNRSVNIVSDSPRVKKRKIRKGRVSPNTFIVNNQKYPNGVMNQIHHSKRVSLEQEELALLARSRPKSAKLKKKNGKSNDKSK